MCRLCSQLARKLMLSSILCPPWRPEAVLANIGITKLPRRATGDRQLSCARCAVLSALMKLYSSTGIFSITRTMPIDLKMPGVSYWWAKGPTISRARPVTLDTPRNHAMFKDGPVGFAPRKSTSIRVRAVRTIGYFAYRYIDCARHIPWVGPFF